MNHFQSQQAIVTLRGMAEQRFLNRGNKVNNDFDILVRSLYSGDLNNEHLSKELSLVRYSDTR